MIAYIEVPLTMERVAIIDLDDAVLVMQYKWYCIKRHNGTIFYATRKFGRGTIGRRDVCMHTFLTGYKITDHRNGNGLDNRRSNLREVTQLENTHNRRKGKSSLTEYKGVSYIRTENLWGARIRIGSSKRLYLGRFKTEREAAIAYDNAARIYHGEYARLNFPVEGEQSALRS